MAASGNITPGQIPAETLQSARDAAELTVNKVYGVCLPSDKDCLDLIYRYYTAHLLYIWGFALPVISSTVGDVSTAKGAPVNLGDKTGNSPYFIEFKKLLNCPDGSGDFLTSI